MLGSRVRQSLLPGSIFFPTQTFFPLELPAEVKWQIHPPGALFLTTVLSAKPKMVMGFSVLCELQMPWETYEKELKGCETP